MTEAERAVEIDPRLIDVIAECEEFERADTDWLLAGLKSLDEPEQRKLIGGFRKQIWGVAAQRAWGEALSAPVPCAGEKEGWRSAADFVDLMQYGGSEDRAANEAARAVKDDIAKRLRAATPSLPRQGVEREKIARAADDKSFTSEELDAVGKLADMVCDYIERCRTNLSIDGGIRAGVDHHLRCAVLPMLSARPKKLLVLLQPEGDGR